VDLSPRDVVPTAVGTRRRRPWAAVLVLLVALGIGGVFVTKFLTSAVDYYCNVDEIGVKSGCDVGRRIRIQGVVEKGSLAEQGAGVEFVISFDGASMPVAVGSRPTGIFQECVPVVVAGRVVEAPGVGTGLRFEGDEVLVKHDESYDAKNADRVARADDAAAACAAGD
jgi:cytochrome c-type biogenesis protein CcmE